MKSNNINSIVIVLHRQIIVGYSLVKNTNEGRVIHSFMAIAFLFACLQFMACSKSSNDPAPKTQAEQVTTKLTASQWKLSGVTVDGTDQSALFKSLTISFSTSGFTASNGGLVWPSSNTWSFTDSNATTFLRGDGITVSIQEITDTSLKMSLAWSKNTLGPGRTNSIKGQHLFTMGK